MTDREGRLPAGQYLVETLPILDLGKQPKMNTDIWSLTLSGEIEAPQTLDWAFLQTLPQREIVADIHCVTRWSRFDVAWVGVPASEIVRLARPKSTANYVVLGAADEYTTNLPLSALLDDDVLFAHTLEGKPLPYKYGGPVRLVVPKRYFWKSAKWVTGIHFCETDQPGFWETRGYHNDADPFKEERFS
jgi:DMSO/TMAO reductase YedYZ molybdopterin-dependent catalytic subunit